MATRTRTCCDCCGKDITEEGSFDIKAQVNKDIAIVMRATAVVPPHTLMDVCTDCARRALVSLVESFKNEKKIVDGLRE